MNILVLNAGSSSQKCCLYQLPGGLPDSPPDPVWEAQIDWTKTPGVAELKCRAAGGQTLETQEPVTSRQELLEQMVKNLWEGPTRILDPSEVTLVGHRVVHGGQQYQQPTRVTGEVKAEIQRLSLFAPAHNPANLEGIQVIEELLGKVPQVVVFDTAFHGQLPPAAFTYPGPYEWLEKGIRRFGFHGISHQYCSERSIGLLNHKTPPLRLVSCHLGNGCSLAAIRDGRSIDTTMGFTPLEGLMMGTRSGSVDPAILIHLLREEHCSPEDLDRILNKESGLKGISGLSGDMRSVCRAMEEGNARAKLAFEIFVHRLCWHIGAMIASLGGLDALLFTAGIGENSPAVRSAACENFGFLGLRIDPEKNEQSPVDADIAADDSSVRVLVVHTQEDWMIARESWKLCQPESTL